MTQSFAFPTTLYLVPGALQALSDVSVNPGAPQDGYPLVWDNDLGKWVISTLPYSSIDGAPALPIPVTSGGTGTQTGSITGTGALTFASSANGNISLLPNGTGSVAAEGSFSLDVRSRQGVRTGLFINLPASEDQAFNGFALKKGQGEFSLINGTSGTGFAPFFYALNKPDQEPQIGSLFFEAGFPLTPPSGIPFYTNVAKLGVIGFIGRSLASVGVPIPDDYRHFCVWNTYNSFQDTTPSALLFGILGNGNANLKGTLQIRSTSASTNTTSGALQVAGGIGAQGNLIVGGTRINYANLPTSPTATGVEVGDLWRDGDVVKVKV